MKYLLLLFSTVLASSKSLLSKKIGTLDTTVRGILIKNSAVFLTAAIPVLLMASIGGGFGVSWFSVLLALAFAAATVTTQITQMKALSLGSTSITTLIYSSGFLIPTFFGSLFLGESISVIQYVGIAALLVALFIIVKPDHNEKISSAWLIFSVIATLGSGTNAIIQKIHQSSDFSGELYEFLTLTFLFSALLCFVLHFFFEKNDVTPSEKATKNALLFPLIFGLCVSLLNISTLTLAGKLPAVVQFPVYNIGSMILTGIMGIVLFKEKNTKMQLFGFALGCASILIIGLF